MPDIILEDVCKSYYTNNYTVRAVDHVSLTISAHEAVAIVGPSGSGKTTLLNMIGLLLKPDMGTITIGGRSVEALRDRDRSQFRNASFGYIVQDFALLDHETVYKNIRLPLLYHKGVNPRAYRQRIKNAAESLDIADKLGRKAAKLSGGERQRVAIARAIVCDQPVILADEPTGALDQYNKERVIDILMRLRRERECTLIIVTHDLSVAQRCDRIIRMRDGRIIE